MGPEPGPEPGPLAAGLQQQNRDQDSPLGSVSAEPAPGSALWPVPVGGQMLQEDVANFRLYGLRQQLPLRGRTPEAVTLRIRSFPIYEGFPLRTREPPAALDRGLVNGPSRSSATTTALKTRTEESHGSARLLLNRCKPLPL